MFSFLLVPVAKLLELELIMLGKAFFFLGHSGRCADKPTILSTSLNRLSDISLSDGGVVIFSLTL